ncbi:hypothetical protein V2J09_004476 [Rumex salicifolius]
MKDLTVSVNRAQSSSDERVDIGPYSSELSQLDHDWMRAYLNMVVGTWPYCGRIFYYLTVEDGTPRRTKEVEEPGCCDDILKQGIFGHVPNVH